MKANGGFGSKKAGGSNRPGAMKKAPGFSGRLKAGRNSTNSLASPAKDARYK